MDGNKFVNKLKAENEAILAKIDEPPLSSSISNGIVPNGELLATLLKTAERTKASGALISSCAP